MLPFRAMGVVAREGYLEFDTYRTEGWGERSVHPLGVSVKGVNSMSIGVECLLDGLVYAVKHRIGRF